ncbi:SAC3/GANP family protein, partial [Cardiosporidium cionae]
FSLKRFRNEGTKYNFQPLLAEQTKRQERMKRFAAPTPEEAITPKSSSEPTDTSMSILVPPLGSLNWKERLELAKSPLKVIGLNMELEKSFLRLTGLPDPANVRPESVLHNSLKYIQEKYLQNRNWHYIEEQFRSIRQDLAVQSIKNEFTIEVYETNARLALKNNDLGQFNQCQTQLKELYRMLPQANHRVEFLCYRLIYMALQNMTTHLIRVVGNWRRYFRMAEEGPFLIGDLCRVFEGKMRMVALSAMAKSSLSLDPERVAKELFFPSVSECIVFLREQKTVWTNDGKINSKLSCAKYVDSNLLKSRKVRAMG